MNMDLKQQIKTFLYSVPDASLPEDLIVLRSSLIKDLERKPGRQFGTKMAYKSRKLTSSPDPHIDVV